MAVVIGPVFFSRTRSFILINWPSTTRPFSALGLRTEKFDKEHKVDFDEAIGDGCIARTENCLVHGDDGIILRMNGGVGSEKEIFHFVKHNRFHLWMRRLEL
jgi:hypothetical protein